MINEGVYTRKLQVDGSKWKRIDILKYIVIIITNKYNYDWFAC